MLNQNLIDLIKQHRQQDIKYIMESFDIDEDSAIALIYEEYN